MRASAHIAPVFAAGLSLSMLTGQVSSTAPLQTSVSPIEFSTFAIAASGDSNSKTNQQDNQQKSDETSAQKEEKPEPKIKKVKVTSGDSLTSIADNNHTTWVRLFNANSYIKDPNMIYPGKSIEIPPKGEKLPNRYEKLTTEQVATMPKMSSKQVASAASPTSSKPVSMKSGGGANRYSRGQCTWYVKNKRPDIGNMWGNGGYGWLSAARSAGFSTGHTARPGAIAVMSGHVAYVESVSGGKVHLSEMNYGGGVGVVHTRTVSANKSFQYIY